MNPATCQLNRTNFEPDSKMCYECLKLHDLDFCFFERKPTIFSHAITDWRVHGPTNYHEVWPY